MAKQELSPEQKKQILEEFKEHPNIEYLTQSAFGNKNLDGRSWQGKLVAALLVDQKLNYKTTKFQKREPVRELTDDDKQYIISAIQNGENIINVARIIYKDDNIKRLSAEWRRVQAYCEVAGITSINEEDEVALGVYQAPRELARLVNIVNGALGTIIQADKISGKYKAYFDKLRVNLDNSKLKRILNAYESKKDRDLFVDEFVRLTFEKPDLTPDELNLYMQIVRDGISLEVLEGKINKMNQMFMDIEEASELNQRFSENLKACVDEKNQVTKRIADTTKKLQGDRGERLKNQGKSDTSFIAVVQLAQEEVERKNMLRLAELQRAAISHEANRLESMDELRCRIMGVDKEDVI
jgi:hypothetical protein